MTTKGDIIVISSDIPGQPPRKGLVLDVLGSILKIQWDDDTETMFIPGPGSLQVVGHEHTAMPASSSG